LPIARNGDEMELDTYFAALEQGFKKVESEYNWAVANKKPNAKDLGEAFDKALLIYNAALDVRFDVTEAVRQEQLIPEVSLTEEEQDDIAAPIKTARAKKGGEKDIRKVLRSRFDVITGLETKLSKNKADNEVQTQLARARAIYDYVKDYAKKSKAKQVGADPSKQEPEPVPAEKQEIKLDDSESKALEDEIRKQREEEARLIKEAVAKANAELAAQKKEADAKKAAMEAKKKA
jgi:hypothetical protein